MSYYEYARLWGQEVQRDFKGGVEDPSKIAVTFSQHKIWKCSIIGHMEDYKLRAVPPPMTLNIDRRSSGRYLYDDTWNPLKASAQM